MKLHPIVLALFGAVLPLVVTLPMIRNLKQENTECRDAATKYQAAILKLMPMAFNPQDDHDSDSQTAYRFRVVQPGEGLTQRVVTGRLRASHPDDVIKTLKAFMPDGKITSLKTEVP